MPDVVIGLPAIESPVGTVIATDVTEPVPAPIAVRKEAASSEETVLSALKRGKAIAATFVIVNRFEPRVVAPKEVRPVEATKFVEPPSH